MTPTLPVDAPAPIPTVSPYPLGIASFYYPNFNNNVQAKPYDATVPLAEQFDVNSQEQPWGRPLDPSEVATAANTYRLWGSLSTQGLFVPNSIARNLLQASKPNVAPYGMPQSLIDSLATTVYYTQPAIPIPARPPITTPAPGEQVSMVMGQFVVTNSNVAGPAVPQTPQQIADSAKLDTIIEMLKTVPGVVVPAGV